jgi:hypothetical protein
MPWQNALKSLPTTGCERDDLAPPIGGMATPFNPVLSR